MGRHNHRDTNLQHNDGNDSAINVGDWPLISSLAEAFPDAPIAADRSLEKLSSLLPWNNVRQQASLRASRPSPRERTSSSSTSTAQSSEQATRSSSALSASMLATFTSSQLSFFLHWLVVVLFAIVLLSGASSTKKQLKAWDAFLNELQRAFSSGGHVISGNSIFGGITVTVNSKRALAEVETIALKHGLTVVHQASSSSKFSVVLHAWAMQLSTGGVAINLPVSEASEQSGKESGFGDESASPAGVSSSFAASSKIGSEHPSESLVIQARPPQKAKNSSATEIMEAPSDRNSLGTKESVILSPAVATAGADRLSGSTNAASASASLNEEYVHAQASSRIDAFLRRIRRAVPPSSIAVFGDPFTAPCESCIHVRVGAVRDAELALATVSRFNVGDYVRVFFDASVDPAGPTDTAIAEAGTDMLALQNIVLREIDRVLTEYTLFYDMTDDGTPSIELWARSGDEEHDAGELLETLKQRIGYAPELLCATLHGLARILPDSSGARIDLSSSSSTSVAPQARVHQEHFLEADAAAEFSLHPRDVIVHNRENVGTYSGSTFRSLGAYVKHTASVTPMSNQVLFVTAGHGLTAPPADAKLAGRGSTIFTTELLTRVDPLRVAYHKESVPAGLRPITVGYSRGHRPPGTDEAILRVDKLTTAIADVAVFKITNDAVVTSASSNLVAQQIVTASASIQVSRHQPSIVVPILPRWGSYRGFVVFYAANDKQGAYPRKLRVMGYVEQQCTSESFSDLKQLLYVAEACDRASNAKEGDSGGPVYDSKGRLHSFIAQRATFLTKDRPLFLLTPAHFALRQCNELLPYQVNEFFAPPSLAKRARKALHATHVDSDED